MFTDLLVNEKSIITATVDADAEEAQSKPSGAADGRGYGV